MDKFYKQISDYLNDQLSTSEKLKFEDAMTQDPLLRSAIENKDILSYASNYLIEEDIRHDITNVRSELKSSNLSEAKVIKSNIFGRIAIAASFIALLGIGYVVLKNNNSTDYDSLYVSNYRSPVDRTVRGDHASDNVSTRPCDTGHKEMDNQKYQKAIDIFKTASASLDKNCIDKSEWYTALAMLKTQDEEGLRKALIKIVQNKDHNFLNKATKLLDQLN